MHSFSKMNEKTELKLTAMPVGTSHKPSRFHISILRCTLIDGFTFIPIQAESSLKEFTQQKNQDF